MFKNLDELEQAVLDYTNKKNLPGLNSKCNWSNCAIGCRLKELGIIEEDSDTNHTYNILSRKAIGYGMDFNYALQESRTDRALSIIKTVRDLGISVLK